MGKTVGIGCQDFEMIRKEDLFYMDKTEFIREWWENADDVTLITRPRRFGKTLNMSMLEKFFSVQYAGREDLIEAKRYEAVLEAKGIPRERIWKYGFAFKG